MAGLWLAGEMVNRIGIYGSKVAEGLSAFQRLSCVPWFSLLYPYGQELTLSNLGRYYACWWSDSLCLIVIYTCIEISHNDRIRSESRNHKGNIIELDQHYRAAIFTITALGDGRVLSIYIGVAWREVDIDRSPTWIRWCLFPVQISYSETLWIPQWGHTGLKIQI